MNYPLNGLIPTLKVPQEKEEGKLKHCSPDDTELGSVLLSFGLSPKTG